MGYYEGEVGALGNNCNNNGWNDWSWIIGLAVVGGIFGNGGFGFGNGNREPAPATQADLANGFAQNTLQRGIDDIILGQANAINYNNQGFAGLNQTITDGFAGVNNAVCTLGYQNQAGFNALANQISSCCCDTRSAIADVKYSNERNTCDIINAINAGNQRLVDIYTSDKISALQTENASLKSAINNEAQTATLLRAINRTPEPAYIVPNPYCCSNYSVTGTCGSVV